MRNKNGTFSEGNPGKPKGAKHKSTLLRERISGLIESNFKTLQSDLVKMEPKERAKVLIDLLPYVIGKMQPEAALWRPEGLSNEDLERIVNELLKQ